MWEINMNDILSIVKELCSYPAEREWFEFKHNWFEPEQLGQYISSLSNSAAMEGRSKAYFVWGIDDKTHDIVGTDFDPDSNVKNEPLKHFLSRGLSPDVNFTFEEAVIGGKRIVLLTIPAAKTVPVSFSGERFIRIGSSKENLRKYPEKESYLFEVLRHGLPTIENTPSQYQDLTFEKLLIYYGAKGIRLNEDTFKKNLGFFTYDGKYNILAQLMSDNSHLPLRFAIFSGKTKTSTLFSVREFGYQCLLYSLDEVLRYGDVLNIIQADERNRIVERKETALFENDAFREAMINAFVHNKWVEGNEPMISVFSDRIEILSRGIFPPEQTLEGFFAGESVPVNQKLSEIFLQLHISEKTGRGVPKVIEKYGRDAYEFRENSIVVKIPFRWINTLGEDNAPEEVKLFKVKNETTPKTNLKTNLKTNPKTNPKNTQEKILKLIAENPKITRKQMAEACGISLAGIKWQIMQMKEKIEFVGSSKTGYWKILSETDEKESK